MNGELYSIVILVAALVLLRRTRSMFKPTRGTGLRLLLPIIFMLPCFLLILNPNVHAYMWEWLAALLLGGVLSLPLIWTTDYEIREDGAIYTKKNLGFIIAFLMVLGIRFTLRAELDMLDASTKTALFMTVVLGYVIPWRVVSYWKYREVFKRLTA